MAKRASKPAARAPKKANKAKATRASAQAADMLPTPPSSSPSSSPSPAPARGARVERDEPRWRAAEERLSLRLAVLEDVVRRNAHEARASHAELGLVRTAHTELARRVADVEKRSAASGP